MKLFLVGLAALVYLTAQPAPVAEELARLEGTYKMVRGDEGGKPVDPEIAKTAKLVISGNKHVVQLGKETITGTHTVNPLEKPKSIDATDTMGRFAGKTVKGIYKLDGDEFTVCFPPADGARPTDFTTNQPGRLLHVWKRTK